MSLAKRVLMQVIVKNQFVAQTPGVGHQRDADDGQYGERMPAGGRTRSGRVN
ncbi:MAG: hypothetical protein IH895_02275 [Planctomycetes bacterium]|nr:hypothetical protein [Planctomycetota bacterium]